MKKFALIGIVLPLANISIAQADIFGGNGPGNAGSSFASYFSGLATYGLETLVKTQPKLLTPAQVAAVKNRIRMSRVELTNARLCWNSEDNSCEPVAALIAKNEPTIGRIRVNPVMFWQLNLDLRVQKAVHEYLGLEGIENDATPISGYAYLSPQQAARIQKDQLVVALTHEEIKNMSADGEFEYYLIGNKEPTQQNLPGGEGEAIVKLGERLCQYLGFESYVMTNDGGYLHYYFYYEKLLTPRSYKEYGATPYHLHQVSAIDGTMIEVKVDDFTIPFVIKSISCGISAISAK